MVDKIANQVAETLGLSTELDILRGHIAHWVENTDKELREPLVWQFLNGAKYYRPLTVFVCYRSVHDNVIPQSIMLSAVAIELFHNVSLIIDDILDHSRHRRNKLTLHCRFGNLRALMAAGYIVADGYEAVVDDTYSIRLFSELLKRLGAAECLQWRLRRQPTGVEDWRHIAGEDTGSMFEVCACLGARTDRLRRFGRLLGILYHGCDDVADVRGVDALGGGGNDDVRDGILTLPAALAVRDQQVADMFRDPGPQNFAHLGKAFKDALPEAEAYLDSIAEEARAEARIFSNRPEELLSLIEHTRSLSNR